MTKTIIALCGGVASWVGLCEKSPFKVIGVVGGFSIFYAGALSAGAVKGVNLSGRADPTFQRG